MDNFLYFIGGTGTRIESAFLHLCAMNLINAGETLHVVSIDKDAENGNTTAADSLAGLMTELSDPDNLKPTGKIAAVPDNKELFRNRIVREGWSFDDAFTYFATGAATGDATAMTFKASYHPSIITGDNVLFNAFYSLEQQGNNLINGFDANPQMGSTLFTSILQQDRSLRTAGTANTLLSPLFEYHTRNNQNDVRVFIVGSIFGGTGASCFYKLARYIYEETKGWTHAGDGHKLVHIGGVLLLPYFRFKDDPNAIPPTSVDPNVVWEETRVALKHYANIPHLMKDPQAAPGTDAGIFEALYLLGQQDRHYTAYSTARGGSGQRNHFDLIDLLAADAVKDFVNTPLNANWNLCRNNDPRENRYAYVWNSTMSFGLADLSTDLKDGLLKMLRFSIAVCHCRADLESSNRNLTGSMLTSLCGKLDTPFHGADDRRKATVLREEGKAATENVFKYCKSFLDFAYDLAQNGKDWQSSLEPVNQDDAAFYALLNRDLLNALRDIITNWESINNDRGAGDMGRIVTGLKSASLNSSYEEGGAATYASADSVAGSIEENVFDEGARRVYRGGMGTETKDRVNDYLQMLFTRC